tara:strand:+ start:2290 stop:3033 length:744 start_codon:yes stop_codon:yes gene_type:complete
MSRNLIVIPARIDSTRFPKKMLYKIQGKPLIDWTISSAKKTKNSKILVATDNEEIAKRAKKNNVECLMTPKGINSGTERVSYAVRKIRFNGKVVNWQGDEPMVNGADVENLFFLLNKYDVVTLATKYIGNLNNENRVKANINKNMEAIDFSRKNTFFHSEGVSLSGKKISKNEIWDECWEHIGIYGYRSEALKRWTKEKPSKREKQEKLEQLTALEIGLKIGVQIIKSAPIGINTIQDVDSLGTLRT